MYQPEPQQNFCQSIIFSNLYLHVCQTIKNASAGWNQIPTFMVKGSLQYFKTHLINKSIHQGIFPDDLKVAKVIPVYKFGNKSNISNYRPISGLSFFSKVFEKVMYIYITITTLLIS